VTTGIDRAAAAHLARLARLALTDEELDTFVPQIEAVMAVVLPCLAPEEALAAAPSVEDGRFRVPPGSWP
jgi:aspartyl-tRNA(Asn)/glutamyl-tRNA(Gln) amidotransferase subunit C